MSEKPNCNFNIGETHESARLWWARQEGDEDRPKPQLQAPSDAIVKIVNTTICGTNLHILKGDVAACAPGRILGHEGVGVIDSVGAAVTRSALATAS